MAETRHSQRWILRKAGVNIYPIEQNFTLARVRISFNLYLIRGGKGNHCLEVIASWERIDQEDAIDLIPIVNPRT